MIINSKRTTLTTRMWMAMQINNGPQIFWKETTVFLIQESLKLHFRLGYGFWETWCWSLIYKRLLGAEKHKLSPKLYNVDESRLSTIHKPHKVIALVTVVSPGERGVTVPITECPNQFSCSNVNIPLCSL